MTVDNRRRRNLAAVFMDDTAGCSSGSEDESGTLSPVGAEFLTDDDEQPAFPPNPATVFESPVITNLTLDEAQAPLDTPEVNAIVDEEQWSYTPVGREGEVGDKAYSLNAIGGFFTYPRCNDINVKHATACITKDDVKALFTDVTMPVIKKCIIACEPHAEPESLGFDHIHVIVRWDKKYNIKDMRKKFACGGRAPNFTKYHESKFTYLIDHEGQTKVVDPDPIMINVNLEELRAGSVWAFLLAIEDRAEFISQCVQRVPREWLLNGTRILANWDMLHPPVAVSAPMYHGPFPKHMHDLVKGHNWDTHGLHLWGESGIGKTSFAKYIMAHECGGHHMVKGSIDELRNWDRKLPLLFDDIVFTSRDDKRFTNNFSREITSVQDGTSVPCRYQNVPIAHGIPRTFTTNIQWAFFDPQESVYNRRIKSHHFTEMDYPVV